LILEKPQKEDIPDYAELQFRQWKELAAFATIILATRHNPDHQIKPVMPCSA